MKLASDSDPQAACNGTIVNDTEMGEVIQLQGDQRKDVQEFLVDKKEGLELDAKTIKVSLMNTRLVHSPADYTARSDYFPLDVYCEALLTSIIGAWLLDLQLRASAFRAPLHS